MEVHLFYYRYGFIGYVYEEEIVLVCGKDSLERILAGVFRAFSDKSCAYKYTARFDIESGESWIVERDDTDMEENTFSVTHKENWNITDARVRMSKRHLKSLLKEVYDKTGSNVL